MLSIVLVIYWKGFPALQFPSFKAYIIPEFSNKWNEFRLVLFLMETQLILIGNIQESAITGFA